MSRSVGSGPMPQDDTAAAPAPVTPRTFRKRLRSMESVISVVAHATVTGHVVLDVAADAPSHAQRRDLLDLRHLLYVAVARRTRRRAERFDMTHVRKAHEPRQRVNPNPFRGFPLAPGVAEALDLRAFRARTRRVALQSPAGSTVHHLMAAETGL